MTQPPPDLPAYPGGGNTPPPGLPAYPGGGNTPPPGKLGTGRVWLGIGLMLLVQVILTVAVVLVLTWSSGSDWSSAALLVVAGLELALLVVSIVGASGGLRIDRGVAVGLIIGWAVAFLALPVVGVGICVAAVSQSGSA